MGGHFYAWFPGDYARDTPHLSMVEDAAYRRLLDAYYMSGKVSAIAEVLLRVCRAITPEEQDSVRRVAAEFFEVRDGYLYHEKVEKELARSLDLSSKRSEAGKAGAAKTNARLTANAAANAAANATATHAHYSVSKDTDAGASTSPTAIAPTDPKKRIFDLGVSLLTQTGETERSARTFLGKFAKEDPAKLGEVLGFLSVNPKVSPKSYIARVFQPQARGLVL